MLNQKYPIKTMMIIGALFLQTAGIGVCADETTGAYAAVAESKRDDALSAFNKGLQYEQQQNPVEAIACYKQAIRLSPQVKEPYNNLASVYFELGLYGQAIEFYKKAVAIDPAYAEATINLAMSYYAVGRFPEAIEVFLYASKLTDLGRDGTYFLARTYVHSEKYQDAVALFEGLLQEFPEFYPAHFDLACVYMTLNKFAQARDHFETVLLLAPKHVHKEKIGSMIRMINGLDLRKVDVRNAVR